MVRDLQWKSGNHKSDVCLASGEAVYLFSSDWIFQGPSFHIPLHGLLTYKIDFKKTSWFKRERDFRSASSYLLPLAWRNHKNIGWKPSHTKHLIESCSSSFQSSNSLFLCKHPKHLTSSWSTEHKTFTHTMQLRLIKFEGWKRIWQNILVLPLVLNDVALNDPRKNLKNVSEIQTKELKSNTFSKFQIFLNLG